MKNNAVYILIIMAFLVGSTTWASITYEAIKNLPDFPKSFHDANNTEKLKWLSQQLEQSPTAAEAYNFNRAMAILYYSERNIPKIQLQCSKSKPLTLDFPLRRVCARGYYGDYERYISILYDLLQDAEAVGNTSRVVITLGEIAWRQSEEGYIAEAFSNFQLALDKGKGIDEDTLIGTMFNTATSYIVNGNKEYVHKGIKILLDIVDRNNEIVATNNSQKEKESRAVILAKDRTLQAYFNLGIAYMFHLNKNEKALEYFDKMSFSDNPLGIDALNFSALAAAELGEYDRAKNYLTRLDGKRRSSIVVESYLQCYRDLAQYHWNKNHSVESCANLHPSTTIEVTYDVYNRLSKIDEEAIELIGLRLLRELVTSKLVPQLKEHGSKAASATELNRLQRESEIKSELLEKERKLKFSEQARHATEKKYLIALFFLSAFFIAFVLSQLQQKKKLAKQFERMSIRDPLTKLGNRRYLQQQIEREIAFIDRSYRSDKPTNLGIYLFDIDHFKQINDTYGHLIGDEVLIEISKRINHIIRDTDLLIRWGGEEFVLIARIENKEGVSMIAERIRLAINASPFSLSNSLKLPVSCTIGAVKYPFIEEAEVPTTIWSKLISLVDTALYYGKKHGRNCWVIIHNNEIQKVCELDELLQRPIEVTSEKKLITIETCIDPIQNPSAG